jgi:hypothetical protein
LKLLNYLLHWSYLMCGLEPLLLKSSLKKGKFIDEIDFLVLVRTTHVVLLFGDVQTYFFDTISNGTGWQHANPHGESASNQATKTGRQKCVSNITKSSTKCRSVFTGPKGNCGTQPKLFPLQSLLHHPPKSS